MPAFKAPCGHVLVPSAICRIDHMEKSRALREVVWVNWRLRDTSGTRRSAGLRHHVQRVRGVLPRLPTDDCPTYASLRRTDRIDAPQRLAAGVNRDRGARHSPRRGRTICGRLDRRRRAHGNDAAPKRVAFFTRRSCASFARCRVLFQTKTGLPGTGESAKRYFRIASRGQFPCLFHANPNISH
jgi:hypothetical protein